jgi:hypothetical protein
MITTDHRITPPELVEHPQLAAIELLRTALDVSRTALYAAHPEVTAEDYVPGPDDDDVLIVENLLQMIDDLLTLLPSYPKALHEQARRRENLDILF